MPQVDSGVLQDQRRVIIRLQLKLLAIRHFADNSACVPRLRVVLPVRAYNHSKVNQKTGEYARSSVLLPLADVTGQNVPVLVRKNRRNFGVATSALDQSGVNSNPMMFVDECINRRIIDQRNPV